MKEVDLYPPLARHFEKQGFRVQGEVCGCDLVAVKADDSIVIVELKLNFNVKLLYQAVRRLAITPEVYIAFPRPKARQKMSFWQMVKSLARRLNLGVFILKDGQIQVLVEPSSFQARGSAKQRAKVLKEFRGRRISENQGGVSGTKLGTAYLESAVLIAVLLQKHRKLTAAQLRELGASDKAHAILYRNHYGWFERKDVAAGKKGVYGLKARMSVQIKKEHGKVWEYYASEFATAVLSKKKSKKSKA